ncbi:hypothetical protein KA005_49735 [bacterium]|nr:hypothetical protein [bacterium]
MSAKTELKAEIYQDFKDEELSFQGSITETTGGTFDPITNVTSGATSVDHEVYMVFDEGANTERSREIMPEISATDKLKWVAILADYIPIKGDEIVSSEYGESLSIVFIIENSVGVNGLFKAWLR